jgi:hypothetical protein
MKSIMALALVAFLTGCVPMYYPTAYYNPVTYAPAIQMYPTVAPAYVPVCNLVNQWDAMNYMWRSVQVCR